MKAGSYRRTVESYMRRRNEALPRERRIDPKFLVSLFDQGTPVFDTVARNFNQMRDLPPGSPGFAALRSDPVPWLEAAINRESAGSPPWLTLDYLRKVRDKFRDVEPLGYKTKLPIRDVYVPMTTAPPKSERKGDLPDASQGPVPFRHMFAHLEERKYAERRAVLVVGEPGSGKTTAARQLAWLLACRFHVAGFPADCAPLWLPFRDWEGRPFASLEAFLAAEAEAVTGNEAAGKALLQSGRPLLWILDGFDELPAETLQGQVAVWLRGLRERPARSRDRFLVTSRDLGTEKYAILGLDALAGFLLRPLDEKAQGAFIRHYLRHAGLAGTVVEEQSGKLAKIIAEKEKHSAEERRMARNPMLLSMICFLFADGEKGEEEGLPGDWDDLHGRFVTRLLTRGVERLAGQASVYGSWDPSKFDLPVAVALFERLAWRMQEQTDRVSQPIDHPPGTGSGLFCLADEVEAAIDGLKERHKKAIPNDSLEFLRFMREHIGLMCLQGSKARRMGFLHLNIQESLAADFTLKHAQPEAMGSQLAGLYTKNPKDQREVVRLAVKRFAGNGAFRTALFVGVLEGGLDEKDDVFLGRLVAMAGQEAVPAFVGVINRAETDRWRQGRLLGFVRKFRTPELKDVAEKLKGQDETKWHALEILTEPSQKPPAKGDIWVEKETGMCLVRVKAGKFEMGEGDKKHWVEITKDYWMGKCAVSNGEYGVYVKKMKAINPDYWSDPRFNGEYQPVVGVSWEDAKAFCEWLRGTSGVEIWLPTEAEWEYACRAGLTTKYSCGDSEKQLEEYAWFSTNANFSTHVAGVKRANEWGLYDMHGNVDEWCWEWFGEYPSKSQVDPVGPATGSMRVNRGGCWNRGARDCRAAYRFTDGPDYRFHSVGFRLAVSSTPRK